MKKIKLFLTIVASALGYLNSNAQIKIEPTLMGESYWTSDFSNPSAPVTVPQWNDVVASGVRLVRAGGVQYNTGSQKPPFPIFYVQLVDDIRKNGCEPVITIPFLCVNNPTPTDFSNAMVASVTNAKEIVRILNIVHKRHVKYFVIANEPGIDYGFYSNADVPRIATYVKALAQAVKDVDPEIKTIGPEQEWYNKGTISSTFDGIYDELFSGTGAVNDISGLIPGGYPSSGLPYIDFMSAHNYIYNYQFIQPGQITPGSPFEAYTKLEQINKGSGDPTKLYRGMLRDMQDVCVAIGSRNNPSTGLAQPLAFMVTEANINAHNEDLTLAPSPNTNGLDSRSFLGGQLWARMISLAMEYKTSSIMFWSAREGCPASLESSQNRGYLDGCTGAKQPSYFFYEAMAKYFKGDYYRDEVLNSTLTTDPFNSIGLTPNFWNPTPYPTDFETIAFGSKGENVAVMINNYGGTPAPFTLRLNNGMFVAPLTKKFKFDMGIAGQNNYNVSAYSSKLLVFSCTGTLLKELEYNRSAPSAGFQPVGLNTTITPIDATVMASTTNNCVGTSTSSITINNAGAATFTWYKIPFTIPFATGNPVFGLTSGAYITEISSGTVCSGTTLSLLTVVHQNSALVDAGLDKNICTSANIGNPDLLAGPSYLWAPTTDLSSSTSSSPLCTPTSSPISYTLTADDGVCPLSDGVIVTLAPATGNVMIGDSPEDIGTEPNTQTDMALGMFWLSSDIWNRTQPDNVPYHQNPEHRSTSTCVSGGPSMGSVNTIYVKMTNLGCTNITGSLDVYWAKAGTGLAWPGAWTPTYNCNTFSSCNALCSDHLQTTAGFPTIGSVIVPANSQIIAAIDWCPPNPADYVCPPDLLAAEKGHFCFLAHFDAGASDPLNYTSLDGSVSNQAFYQNNVAWKNVEIVNENVLDFAGPDGGIIVSNISTSNFIRLDFLSRNDDNNQNILNYSKVRIWITKDLMKRWIGGGKKGEGLVVVNDSVIEITKPNAYMDNIFLRKGEIEGLAIELIPFKKMISSKDDYFNFDVVQHNLNDPNGRPDGGERYLIKKNLRSVKPCFTSTNTLSGTIIGTQIRTDSILITGNILVPSGATLKFEKAIVMIAENVRIRVMPGGKLVINNSELMSACIAKKWAGIEVKGSPIFLSPLIITNSFITGSDFPLNLDKSKGIFISNTTFLGYDIGTTIVMNKMKDFEISENTFSNYEIGIKTTNTSAADVRSSIVKNIFLEVKTAIYFVNDNHSKLDIKCNTFSYTDYAINSNQTILKDQGSVGEGAGNEFISNSTLPNNKLKHTSGNNPKYYYDPANPITSGMNVTTIVSAADPACYVYSFDTSSTGGSHMMDPLNPIQESISKKAMDLFAVPNPNSGQASIYFSLGEAMQGELIIMDIYGKIVDRINLNSETSKVDVNYSEFANGIYMLSITNSKGEVMNKKMIISK